MTSVNRAPAPPPGAHRDLGALDLARHALAPQLLHRPDDTLQELDGRAAVAERHHAAVGRDRVAPADLDGAVHHEVAALPLGAEPVGLELADDLERERVVELAHVDVGRAEPGHPERVLRGAPADVAVDQVGAPVAAEVERRWVLVRRAEVVGVAAEHVDRRLRAVGGAVAPGEHERAAPFGRHRAVEQVVRVGDHPAVEDVLGRERPAPVVHGVGMDMAVVADRRRDRRQRLGLRPVHVHVAAGDERELGRGEHAVRRDELVRRARPRRGRARARCRRPPTRR